MRDVVIRHGKSENPNNPLPFCVEIFSDRVYPKDFHRLENDMYLWIQDSYGPHREAWEHFAYIGMHFAFHFRDQNALVMFLLTWK